MCGAIPPLPQYAFMAWCSVKSLEVNIEELGKEPNRIYINDTIKNVCSLFGTYIVNLAMKMKGYDTGSLCM
jgi:hypothetical protein